MMASICRQTERFLPERHTYHDRGGVKNVNGAIGFAAVETARRVGASAIICPTHSGRSARLMSVFRPRLPIIATTPSADAIRRMCFYWGVESLKSTEQWSLQETYYDALVQARKHGLVKPGDLVVITAGDVQTSPRMGDYTTSTNMCMVAQVQ